jgi:hypothetical protein
MADQKFPCREQWLEVYSMTCAELLLVGDRRFSKAGARSVGTVTVFLAQRGASCMCFDS